jgi:hypothetical protein
MTGRRLSLRRVGNLTQATQRTQTSWTQRQAEVSHSASQYGRSVSRSAYSAGQLASGRPRRGLTSIAVGKRFLRSLRDPGRLHGSNPERVVLSGLPPLYNPFGVALIPGPALRGLRRKRLPTAIHICPLRGRIRRISSTGQPLGQSAWSLGQLVSSVSRSARSAGQHVQPVAFPHAIKPGRRLVFNSAIRPAMRTEFTHRAEQVSQSAQADRLPATGISS